MMKVCILGQCEFCDGEAYVFVCEDVDARDCYRAGRCWVPRDVDLACNCMNYNHRIAAAGCGLLCDRVESIFMIVA